MAEPEGAADGPSEVVEEPKGDPDVTEHLRVKLSTINNELQNTMKIVDNYKEDKRMAEKQKNELEESKKEILVLKRRLSDSESNCKRYRNERNDLRRDIERLIRERKKMISYEEDVQQLKRDIEMQKNKYDRNNNEWKTKYAEAENKYEELIREQKLKIESAEQEVQQLTNDLALHKETSEKENMTLVSNQVEETNLDTELQQDDDLYMDQEEEDPEYSGVKIKKRKKYSVHKIHKTYENYAESEQPESKEDNTTQADGDQNEPSQVTQEVTEEPQKDVEESEVIDRTTGKNKELDAKQEPTDLCEVNGPKDIAEKYEALYESKWTSAYEHICLYFENEEEAVEALLEILQDIMNFCKSTAQGQIDDIYRILTFSSDQGDDQISETITKHLKECMKEISSAAKEYLYELYVSDHHKKSSQHLQYLTGIETFVKDCFELCWLTVIQDPAVVFYPLAKENDACDMEKYKPYKSTGSYVNFVVLPALLLHEDGPVLAAGVAEYGNEQRTKQKMRISDRRRFMSKPVTGDTNDDRKFDTRYHYFKRDRSEFVLRHETDRELLKARDEPDFGDIDRLKSSRGMKFADKCDFDTSDHSNSRGRRGFATKDDFDSHNSSHLGSRNEDDFREKDRFVPHDEIRVGQKSDLISKDQRDPPRGKRQLHATDEVAYQGSGQFVSRHETELDEKHRIDDDVKLGVSSKDRRDVRFKHDFDSKGYEHVLVKDHLVSRNETDFDKENRSDFFLNERDNLGDRTGSAFRKTYAGSRSDFITRDDRDFRRREDIEMTSRHGENYPHVQLYHGHTRSPYENNLYASTETDMYNFGDETGPAYSQSTILTKARGTTNVWKPSYGYERDPTPDEMRLYFQYIDRNDHTGARDVLGHAAYMRCRRRDHNKHLYI